jgi:arginyl-tRNA synthetase
MKRHLEGLLRQALSDAVAAGELRVDAVPPLVLEVPSDPGFGDLASNVALVLARQAGRPPRALAETILGRLRDPEGWLASTEVAGPGFINFRFAPPFWRMILREALAAGEAYGRSRTGEGRRVHIEFVSANPTGPLHIGHGRGAVIGDVTARLLAAVGYEVEREYYVNDHGRQMDVLGRSTLVRYRQLRGEDVPLPEDAYPGEYVVDVARQILAQDGDAVAALPEDEAVARCRDFAARVLLAEIRADLDRFGVRFDRFVSERALHARGALDAALAALPPDVLYREDGALFFRTTRFGDEKDRAAVRGTGEPTYFGGDVAHYHENLQRGFEQLVNVLGADHHGYGPRLKALVAALGFDPKRLRVLLVQLVNLTRGGEPVRMGKRAGEFVTLREVLDEVGPDAARFFFLLRKADSPLDFDLALAKQQSTDNPVFYVQYAHARIASVFRQAAESGVLPDPAPDLGPDLEPLGEAEVEPLRLIATYPDVVETAARELEPHRIVFHVLELAAAFHRYYNRHRILTEDRELTQARLALVRCVQQVLRGALELTGVAAPERM